MKKLGKNLPKRIDKQLRLMYNNICATEFVSCEYEAKQFVSRCGIGNALYVRLVEDGAQHTHIG